jgi:three-Cys-motif partner protein
MNNEVGTEIVEHFESIKMVPTLFFVDPFGYKGLSLRLVNAVLKNWGSDCIFFFNYNRINMGVGNDAVLQHMEALFGPAIIPTFAIPRSPSAWLRPWQVVSNGQGAS